MTAKSRLLLVLPVLLALVGVYLIITHFSKPRYQGRTVDSWFREYTALDGDTNAAHRAFLAMGSKSFPFLTRQLTNAPALRGSYLRLRRQLPASWRGSLPYAPQIPWDARVKAAQLLGSMGTEARPVVPALMASLSHKDENPRGSGGGGYSPGRFNAWSPRFQCEIVRAVQAIDLQLPGLDTALVGALQSWSTRPSDPGGAIKAGLSEAQAETMKALAQIKSPSPRAVADLLRIVEATDRALQRHKIHTAATKRAAAGEVKFSYSGVFRQTNLVVCLADKDPEVAAAGAFELRFADEENPKPASGAAGTAQFDPLAAARLLPLLKAAPTRLAAAETLCFRSAGQLADCVAAALEELSAQGAPPFDGPWDRLRAIEVLRRCRAAAEPALPLLRERMSDPVGFVAVWARKAVLEIETVPKAPAP